MKERALATYTNGVTQLDYVLMNTFMVVIIDFEFAGP